MHLRAVVTGASRGIGYAVSQSFAADGMSVAAISRTPAVIEVGLQLTRAIGCRHVGIQCDVRDSATVNQAFKTVEEHLGGVDILVNAAGIARDSLLIGMKDDDINDVIQTNLVGSINTCRAAVKSMLRNKFGCIINVGSVVGIYGNTGQSVYSSTKSGLIGLTKSLAWEMGPRGVRVNLIAPGFIHTHMTETLSEEKRRALQARISLGRFGTPQEVADVVLLLVKASYINGQVIVVDGGLHV